MRNPDGAVTMTVMVSVFGTLDGPAIRRRGELARVAADAIEDRVARYGEPGGP
ncbi:hypothetical protein [Mycolicibacterium palauense]|uniref:hypothetical protein n=1 Tax=Mycolicibacterium palauense TaxID=2034511 RepID=UPI00159B8B85|nr:hypothetical protein [Mycolicibacterium palauense]